LDGFLTKTSQMDFLTIYPNGFCPDSQTIVAFGFDDNESQWILSGYSSSMDSADGLAER